MTTSVTQTDSQISPPKGLVRLEFPSAAAKQRFLEIYCREIPPERCGNIPSRRQLKNAKVIPVDENGLPRKTDQLKTVINQTRTPSQCQFAGQFRQRMKKP